MANDDGFLSRWSRRKATARTGEAPPEPSPAAPPAAVPAAVAAQAAVEAPAAPEPPSPAPTLDDVAELPGDAADFSRFVARDVQPDVRNAALKKLFADPHFNVMDGLDIYIDDYGKPDPLPASMLRQMAQGRFLGLFDDEDKADADAAAAAAAHNPGPGVDRASRPAESAPATATEPLPPPNEDVDLRLQSHHAAGRRGDPAGAVEEPERPA